VPEHDGTPPDIDRQFDAASLACQRLVHELYDTPLSDDVRRHRLITIISDFTAEVRGIVRNDPQRV
jgi:hypothetical protein